MNRLLLITGSTLALLAAGCYESSPGNARTPSGALFRLHTAGVEAINADPSGTRFKEIHALPVTKDLVGGILDKLARTPSRALAGQVPKDAPDLSTLIRPLLDDLVRQEVFLELRGAGDALEFFAAAHLNDARAQLWSTNLWQIVGEWKAGPPRAAREGAALGWEARAAQSSPLLRVLRAEGWLLLGVGADPSQRMQGAVEAIAKQKRPLPQPAPTWVDLELDCPRLSPWLPVFKKYRLPPVKLTVEGDGEHLRTRATLSYSQPLKLDLKDWELPVALISDPLVSFTAMRGVRPLLSSMESITSLGMNPVPDRVFFWGQPYFKGQTLMAIPYDDPTNAVLKLAPTLPKMLSEWIGTIPGEIYWVSNKSELAWRGLPFLMPFVKPLLVEDKPFLVSGLAPVLGKTNPPPPELFSQLKRENVIYYDWEYTSERLIHHRHYYQFGMIISKRKTYDTNGPSFRWMQDVYPMLGNTATEITQEGPAQLAFSRKSHVGLTGFEIVTLLRWADSAGFPLTFELPPEITIPEGFREKLQQSNPSRPPTTPPPGGPASGGPPRAGARGAAQPPR